MFDSVKIICPLGVLSDVGISGQNEVPRLSHRPQAHISAVLVTVTRGSIPNCPPYAPTNCMLC